jgi:hypothetical protein
MTNALLFPSDPEAPGEARVRVALLPAASLIVPLFKASEVVSTYRQKMRQETQVKEILNTVVVSDVNQMFIQQALCHNLISKMIETTTPDPSDYFRVEDV